MFRLGMRIDGFLATPTVATSDPVVAVERTLLTQVACTFGAGMPPTGGSWSSPPFRRIVTMCGFVLAVNFRAANCATISRHVPVIAPRRQFRGTRCPRCRSTQVRMPASIRSHDQSIRPSVRLPSRMPISNVWPSRHPEPMDPPRAPRLPAELFGRARPIGKGENRLGKRAGDSGGRVAEAGAGGAPALVNRLCTTADSLE